MDRPDGAVMTAPGDDGAPADPAGTDRQTRAAVRDGWHEFGAGFAVIAPAAISVMPIGLLYGALAVQKGLSIPEVALASALIFAGSAQFVGLELWTTPASWLLLGLAALTINLRHIMMGASLGRHLGDFSLTQKVTGMALLADETWALAERRARTHVLSPAYYWGLGLPLYLSWVLFSVAGAFAGALIGDPARYGLDFAFAALFIALLVGFWTGPRTGLVITASAVAALAVKGAVGGAWYVIAGGAAGMLAAAILPNRASGDAA